ncbi:MAG TPA: hypothetical protein VM553_08035, partial [Dongiaceae bacterium]|nr:hypothetical protein [Dongiaceae bacterium]
LPGINCSTKNIYSTPPLQRLLRVIFSSFTGAWNLLFPATRTLEQMENRKIYNTLLYSQGNEGHKFSAVLTDEESEAIIEYLKTL